MLDFTAPAQALAARINGLNPWPGCSIDLNGQPVKLGLADTCHPLDDMARVTGTTADPTPGNVIRYKGAAPGTVLGYTLKVTNAAGKSFVATVNITTS